jgi:hypothetical protein
MQRSLLGVAAVSAVAAAVIVGVAACTPPPSGMSHGPGPGKTVGTSAGSASNGPGGPADAGAEGGDGPATFRVVCTSSHVLPDDPIVHPNMPGMSHLHQFFGNATTNAASTASSLLGEATTCSTPDDASGYWVPVLYQSGVAVPALSTLTYYRGGSHRDASTVQPFPAGLRMIAGSATATAPFPTAAISWTCQGMTTVFPSPPNCGSGGTLTVQVRFPDCWDGVHLDSPDHKSHMAYTISGFCPTNYPVPVPLLELNVRYRTSGGPGVTVASGASYTYHADFFNAWKQSALAGLVAVCLHSKSVCGTIT